MDLVARPSSSCVYTGCTACRGPSGCVERRLEAPAWLRSSCKCCRGAPTCCPEEKVVTSSRPSVREREVSKQASNVSDCAGPARKGAREKQRQDSGLRPRSGSTTVSAGGASKAGMPTIAGIEQQVSVRVWASTVATTSSISSMAGPTSARRETAPFLSHSARSEECRTTERWREPQPVVCEF